MTRISLFPIFIAIWAMTPLFASGLKVTQIEITQGIQALSSGVGLVAGKPTTVRVYVESTSNNDISQVKGELVATLNNVNLSPTTVKSFNLMTAQPTANTNLTAQRLFNHLSLVVQLPSSWIDQPGDLTIWANVSSPSGKTGSASTRIQIKQSRPLKVELVPIRDFCNTCTESDGPSRREMLNTLRLAKQLYPTSQIEASISSGWIKMPKSRHAGTLMAYLIQSNLLNNGLGGSFPRAAKDVVRMGILPKASYFLRNDGSPEPLNGYGIGESRTGFVMLGVDNPQMTMAHELGHCLGMQHVPDGLACPLGATNCEPYPYHGTNLSDGSATGFYGWNNQTGALDPTSYGDIMSYQSDRWISDYSYRKMFCLINNLDKDLTDRLSVCGNPKNRLSLELPYSEKYIMMSGSFASNELTQLKTHAIADVDPSKLNPIMEPIDWEGRYLMQVISEDGSVTFEYPFNTQSAHFDGQSAAINVQSFHLALPLTTDTQRIVLIDLVEGREIRQLTKSTEALQLEVEQVPARIDDSQLQLNWSLEAEDVDSLEMTILYSRDGGQSWENLAAGLAAQERSTLLNTENWPQTDEGMLAVIVSDGFQMSHQLLGPFQVDNKPPTVMIYDLTDTNELNLPFNISAVSFDAEDGSLSGEQIEWISNIDGLVGFGSDLLSTELSPGHHQLTMTATDSQGLQSSELVELDIFR